MALASRKKLLQAYKEIDLFRAKYRHEDFTPHAWCFHGNQAQEWSGKCKDRRLEIVESTVLSATIDADTYKHLSFYLEMPNYVRISENETGPRPNGYSYMLYIDSGEEEREIRITSDIKLVYLDMTEDESWVGPISNLSIRIKLLDNTGKEISTEYPKAIANMEYFKVDKINVFEEARKNPTAVARDINILREKAEGLNTGYHNDPCDLGDVPGYSRIAGICGNEDIVTYGKKPNVSVTRDPSCPAYIDWGKSGSLDDRVTAFMSKVKSGDLDGIISKVESMAPYNGCSTCDLHTCSCYAVHYGYVGCQTCDGCNQYSPCATGCDVGCYSEARSCSCDMGCYAQATGCTCDGQRYGYKACTCNGTTYTTGYSCGTCDTYTVPTRSTATSSSSSGSSSSEYCGMTHDWKGNLQLNCTTKYDGSIGSSSSSTSSYDCKYYEDKTSTSTSGDNF